MRTFIPKPEATRQATHADLEKHRIGRREANSKAVKGDGPSVTGAAPSAHDFSRIPVYAKDPVKLQASPAVNTPGDIYEQEADRVAEQVMAAPARPSLSGAPPRIQRFAGQPEQAPASVDHALADSGRPLESALRQDMEQGFGHDFSRVRIHSGAAAEQSARDVNALAYTIGHNIVFGAGLFAPETREGRRLLAHELAHVVQQSEAVSNSGPALLQRQVPPASEPAAAEVQPGAETSATSAEEAEKKGDTPIRQELLRLFSVFEKQVVGDELFEKIYTKEAWDKRKKEEADATVQYDKDKKKYDEAMKVYNSKKVKNIKDRPPMPIPVAKFTTCIITQAKLLQFALKNKGLSIKKAGKNPRFDFATEGQKNAEKLGTGIFHVATAPMPDGKRPRPGDIIVLASRGKKVDDVGKLLNYVLTIKYGTGEKAKASERAISKLAAAEAANEKAEIALETLKRAQESQASANPKKAEADLKKAEADLTRAVAALEKAKKAADDAQVALQTSEAQAQADAPPYVKKLDEERKKVDHTKVFEFSHVGFLKEEIVKNKDGTEKWTTFDGGQTVQTREQQQGAETVTRTYDPKTNEISGEKSQGGQARWLQGWVDVDQLIAKT